MQHPPPSRAPTAARSTAPSKAPSKAPSTARGALLVEFALVALALYLLFAAILELGRLTLMAGISQDAARVAARELALVPLAPTATFEQALADPLVRATVYSTDGLVIDLDALPPDEPLEEFVATLPPVNRALRPLMIYDRVDVGGVQRNLLRFPGALLTDPASPSGLTVGIPRVVERAADGTETIRWVPVLEEVRVDAEDPASGPFSTAAEGLVALRLNVPYQAAAFSGYADGQVGAIAPASLESNLGSPIVANDAGVVVVNPGAAPGAPAGASAFPTYAGPYGLGVSLALGQELRPFRRLVTAQALFRREVFD